MAREHRNRKLVYKRCEVFGSRATLRDLLEAALAECGSHRQRQEHLDEDGRHNRFINGWRSFGRYRSGSLFEYTAGHLPAGFSFPPDDIDELPLATLIELDENTHMLEGQMQFLVADNHVVFIPSSALRSDDLERHFRWLLRTRTSALGDHGDIAFRDELPLNIRDQGWRGVTSVVLRRKLHREMFQQGPEQIPNSAIGKLEGVARGLLGGLTGELSVPQLEALDRLGVRLQIGFSGRAPIDTSLLDHVATLLRDEDAQEYELNVRGIGTVRGNQVKLEQKKSVVHHEGRPDSDSARTVMVAWLTNLIQSGRVRP